MKIGLTLLLLLSSSFGQGYNFQNLPFLGAGGPSLFPPGLYLRWIDRDLTNGSTVVWTDEIQSYNAVQTNASIQPLMTSTGLVFATNHRLGFTNVNGNVAKYSFVFCVYYMSDPGSGQAVMFDDTGGFGNESFVTTAGSPRWRQFQNGTGTFDVTGFIPTNTVVDFEAGTNLATAEVTYTNGVNDIVSGPAKFIGAALVNMGQVGATPFVVRELDYWTNIAITATISSNLNYYRKITYGGN